jgi:hypothetical protein
MTTRKPYHGQDGPVTFGRPTIGPRVYLVKGPSGWSETYDRKLADRALETFIAPLALDDLIETFLIAVRLEAQERGARNMVVIWEDVVNYLARITKQNAKAVPEIVGVSFWAQSILYEEQEGTN